MKTWTVPWLVPTARWVPRCAQLTEQTVSSAPKSQSLVTCGVINLFIRISLFNSQKRNRARMTLIPCCCMHSTGRRNSPIRPRGHCAKTNPRGWGRSRPAMRAHPAPGRSSNQENHIPVRFSLCTGKSWGKMESLATKEEDKEEFPTPRKQIKKWNRKLARDQPTL